MTPGSSLRNGTDKNTAVRIGAMVSVTNPASVVGTFTPIVITAFVIGDRFPLTTASILGAVELVGLTAALLTVPFTFDKMDRRLLAGAGLVAAGMAHWASGYVDMVVLLGMLRFIAGIGVGAAYAAGVASLTGTQAPGRNFAIAVTVNQAATAILIFLLATMAARGERGVFLALAGFNALTFVTALWLPRRTSAAVRAAPRHERLFSLLGLRILAAMLALSIGFGASWPLSGQVAAARGLTAEAIGAAFSVVGIAAIAGGVAATLAAARGHGDRAHVVGIAGLAVAVAGLLVPAAPFTAVILAIIFFWAFSIPGFFALLARQDTSGRLAVVNGAMIPMGIAIGQLVSAMTGVGRGIGVSIGVGTVVTLLSLLLVYSTRQGPSKSID